MNCLQIKVLFVQSMLMDYAYLTELGQNKMFYWGKNG